MNQSVRSLKEIIYAELEHIKGKSYDELKIFVEQKKIDAYEIESEGKNYDIEIQYFWDSKPNGNIRVIGNINSKGFWDSFFPVSDDFIISPNGFFIG